LAHDHPAFTPNPRHAHPLILLPFVLLPFILSAAPEPEGLRVDQDRIERRIHELSEFGRNPDGGVSRVSFSDADIAGRRYVMGLMQEAGLSTMIDAAGNIIGHREGSVPDLPPILFGSHIDSVPHGGNYDGDVGVIAAIECAQILHERDVATRHPLEVIVFSDEEGGLVGSRALIGDLNPEALEVESHSGKSIREGIEAIGGDPARLSEVRREPGDLRAFLELHIEQGGVLEREGVQIGVVEGIVGINWWEVTIEGVANHAGTTPMDQRQDALIAAAHLTLAINRIVTGTPGRQVGTVGRIRAEPGAPNVIPGKVVMSLELRDLSSEKIEKLFAWIRQEAEAIALRTGTGIQFTAIDATAVPAPTDERVRRLIADSARQLGLSTRMMPSGAGHDAQDVARIAPTGMIFVPSVGGVSHSPKEFTRPEDMANGANVLLQTILMIDRGKLR
jgi:N-carbamoyl-L-amino-acid hydrolase